MKSSDREMWLLGEILARAGFLQIQIQYIADKIQNQSAIYCVFVPQIDSVQGSHPVALILNDPNPSKRTIYVKEFINLPASR